MSKITAGMIAGGVMLCTLSFSMQCAWAEDKSPVENPQTVKSYHGLKFKVSEDWPIVKTGDAYGPMPVEEYMSKKFSEMSARLKKQEAGLAALEKRVETMEKRKRLEA